jgi:hypothetical protein
MNRTKTQSKKMHHLLLLLETGFNFNFSSAAALDLLSLYPTTLKLTTLSLTTLFSAFASVIIIIAALQEHEPSYIMACPALLHDSLTPPNPNEHGQESNSTHAH